MPSPAVVSSPRWPRRLVCLLAGALAGVATGCAHQVTNLSADAPWAPSVRGPLDQHLARLAHTHDGAAPVAVFDCDNTLIKNDVGHQTLFWLVEQERMVAPPGGRWAEVSHHLTPDAVSALTSACGPVAAPARLPTRRLPACGAAVLWVARGRTPSGQPAFQGFDPERMKPTAAFMAQVLQGLTPAEARDAAEAAIARALAAPVGAPRTIAGVTGLASYVRIYPAMAELVAALRDRGVAVWIVSASPQPVVEALARRVGVPTERVLGVRLTIGQSGHLQPRLVGCGPVPDGADGLIPYRLGKRCWINQAVLGVDRAAALRPPPPAAAARAVKGAGDSATDTLFLRDVRGLRLVIDRQDPDLLCHALHGRAAGWLIQPMFIEPLPPRQTPYPCATAACIGPRGVLGPCRDAAGFPMPAQVPPGR